MEKVKRVTVRLPEYHYQELKEKAQKCGVTLSELCRRILATGYTPFVNPDKEERVAYLELSGLQNVLEELGRERGDERLIEALEALKRIRLSLLGMKP